MYVGMTLKLGMQEKDEYIQSAINELWVMEDRCIESGKKLQVKLDQMKIVSKGLPSDHQSSLSRKREAKKDVRKAMARKEKRLTNRMSMILKKTTLTVLINLMT